MSKVEFETDKYYSSNNYAQKTPSKMVNLMIRLGAKNENQANKILLGVALLSFVITLFIILSLSNNSSSEVKVTPEEILEIEKMGIEK